MTKRLTPEPKRALPYRDRQKCYHQGLAILRERHRTEFERIYKQLVDEALEEIEGGEDESTDNA